MRYLLLFWFTAVLTGCAPLNSATPATLSPSVMTVPIAPLAKSTQTISPNMPVPNASPFSTATFARLSDGDSSDPQISADGRYIAFVSWGKLTWNSSEDTASVFVYDRKTNHTELVSVALDGSAGQGRSFNIALSGSGRFVAFYSFAGDLAPDDNEMCDGGTTNCADLFVYDRWLKIMTRIPQGIPTGEGSLDYPWVIFSPDERYIAYSHVDGDVVYALKTGETARILTTPDYLIPGGPPVYFWNTEKGRENDVVQAVDENGIINRGNLSSGGLLAAFSSMGAEWADAPFNQCEDSGYSAEGHRPCFNVFVHNLESGETWLATIGKDGQSSNADIFWPKISADGRFLAFSTAATNLTDDDFSFCDNIHQCRNVFLHDLQTDGTILISREANGALPAGYSHIRDVDISGDGRFITFASEADNLVVDDTNNVADIFVYDRQTEEIIRVSIPNDP